MVMARLTEQERFNIDEISGIVSDFGWQIRVTFWPKPIKRESYEKGWRDLIERIYRYLYKG